MIIWTLVVIISVWWIVKYYFTKQSIGNGMLNAVTKIDEDVVFKKQN